MSAVEQTLYLGTVNKGNGAYGVTQLPVMLQAGLRSVGFGVEVKTAFASATLDVSGDQEEAVKYLDAVELNAVGFTTKDGAYAAVGDKDVTLTAKLSAEETGEGCADIFVKAVRLEV